jgi:hypothetical protein
LLLLLSAASLSQAVEVRSLKDARRNNSLAVEGMKQRLADEEEEARLTELEVEQVGV